MIKLRQLFLFYSSIVCLCCCANSACIGNDVDNDTIQYIAIDASELGILQNSRYIIRDDIDLKGKNLILPQSVTLVFEKGGINNGKITGNNTRIERTNRDAIFSNIKIGGTWNVPEIRTSMFKNIEQENSLREVFALANPSVRNTIYVEKGNYIISANMNKDGCLPVCSNTTLVIDGTIRLTPNGYPRYDILRVKGKNIVIKGKGSIVGDKHNHMGTEGEWGMGIRLHNVSNALVEDLTIRDCWGDCVYVGGNSKNVTIEGCTLDNGRRQGISITKADNVIVKNCNISNVYGTKPEYAIDLEPNQGDTIGYVLIENVTINNCVGGILTTKGNKDKRGKNALVEKIEVRNCTISGTKLYPIRIRRCNNANVDGCTISSNNSYPSIFAAEIGNVTIRNNYISFSMNGMNEAEKSKYESISVSKCGIKKILKNKIVER